MIGHGKLTDLKPISHKMIQWHQLVVFGVLNDKFVAGIAGLVPTYLP